MKSHIDAETLAAFAEGRLKRSEIAAILPHLRECAECSADVAAASSPQPRSRVLTMSAAAAAVIAILAGAAWMLRARIASDPMDRLIALAPRDGRTIETRLAGFEWAPYRGPMRAADNAANEQRMKLVGAAGDAVGNANREPSAATQRTAGVALLLVDEPSDAVTRLRDATQRAPSDPQVWSDLGAALDETAIRLGRPSLHPEALAALDRALRIDPRHAEASFNRAVVLEHLGLTQEARKAWEHYLRIDPSSPWATEARERLRRLPSATGESLFRNEQPRLENAARSSDAKTIDAIVRRFPEQSRTFGEAEYLGRWGANGDANALAVARAAGDALARHSGESLLRDAVRAIDQSSEVLARAHTLYREARIAYSRQQPAAAEPKLRIAASLFETGKSPMSLVARFYAANTRYEQDDVSGARAELERLLVDADAHPEYTALNAHVRWQLALAAMIRGDWQAALPLIEDAQKRFERIGERNNLGYMQTLRATALVTLGRPDEAWAARIRGFSLLSAEGRHDRLPVSLGAAVQMELESGRRDSARALLQLEADAARRSGNDVLLVSALTRDAMLSADNDDADAATRAATEAIQLAGKITDPALHRALTADASLAGGAAALANDARLASQRITRAIDFYRESRQEFFLPQALLLRARAGLRVGDREAAERDLEDGVSTLERHRMTLAGSVAGTDILNAGVALGREAIRLRIEQHDAAGAFSYAERAQLQYASAGERTPVALPELQQRLGGSGTAVLVLTTLPGEIAAICVTEDDVHTARTAFDESTLDAQIARATEGHADAATSLYALLIRPSQPSLARARKLIVIPDSALQHVPFHALYDDVARRYLVEAMPVALAQSATSLRATAISASPRVLTAVSLPSGSMPVLRDSATELAEIRALYRRSVTVEPHDATFASIIDAGQRADVVHLAGHTSRQPNAEETALVFADGRASWRDIAERRFAHQPVVTLAACETVRRPDSRTRSLSIGGGFLAAGASDVIGTLTPIPDRDARELFREIHRHLAAGMPAAEAVRRAQLDALTNNSRVAWRALAVLTRQIVR